MTDLNKQNLSFYRATLLFRELYRRGASHIVISPGSRSTPLVLAAAAHPYIKKHVILDERSAGFTALGIGKATGKPAVLICTSGTAAANYYPAVIEAFQSGVPLLVASADRPPHLRNTDANQTINQIDLFGKFVLSFTDVGEPTGDPSKLDALSETVGDAFDTATSMQGTVHLNFPFSKPLEPETAFMESIQKENKSHGKEIENHSDKDSDQTAKVPANISGKLRKAEKPLIIIGQLPADTDVEPIFELAEQLNVPLLSEQGCSDTGYAIQGYEGFLRNKQLLQQLAPDVILRFGLQPASKSLLLALEEWEPEYHIYVSHRTNKKKTVLPVSDTLEWNGESFSLENISTKPAFWLDRWKKTEEKYRQKKGSSIDQIQELTDGHIYEQLSPQIPDAWWIFFSNSFPARDRSMFGDWNRQKVYTNRGASGIDGITSTAMGIGLGSGKTGILFTGDLAFLHDTNALLSQKLLSRPLVVIIINNNGGNIFRMLPIANHQQYFTPYFETPQQINIAHLCKSYKVNYNKIDTVEKLKKFNLENFVNNSASLLHILECQTNPDMSMKLRQKLWDQA